MRQNKMALQKISQNLRFLLSAIWAFACRPYIASTALAIAITFLSFSIQFNSIEAALYDLRIRLIDKSDADERIRVLLTNNWNVNPFENTITIEDHLATLKKLVAQKPAAIAYLVSFDPADIQSNWQIAEEFVETAENAIADGIQIYIGTDVDLAGEILAPYPLSLLPHYPAVLHKDGTMFARDKVVRRALLTVPKEPSLHLKLAFPDLSDHELRQQAKKIRGAYFYEPAEAWHTIIRFPGDTNWQAGTFKQSTYAQVRNGQANLNGKLVLIDNVYRESINSFINTPFSSEPYMNPKVYVHAAIVDSILNNEGIEIIPGYVEIALTFLFTLGLIFVTVRLSPSQGVVFLVITSATMFLTALFLLDFFGYWMRLANPYFAIFCTYYLVVPYRARIEYKERWKVQQKHDVLLQVEEMKGNFLSLMSHDLKTPVARIQGLSELILRQGGLSEQQKNELAEILDTTDNLNKYISRILNLTKVESSQIKINRKSKDINKIIESCISKLQFHADAKNITLKCDLEPLFPIHIDASLIIQVLNNLIDNAIKYSPVGSTVTISSRERDDHVEIIVEDEGQGFDEADKNQLFTKFFRGKNPASSQIKGSGLGLYLSKYFIELHDGSIGVESQLEQGSRFKVSLPIDFN